MTGPVSLPPFPVDDATLSLLEAAMDPWSHGNPDAVKSALWDFLAFMSELGGSDTRAVAEVHDDGSDDGPSIVTMRDPRYSNHCVITALIAEVRRLRAVLALTKGVHTMTIRVLTTEDPYHGPCKHCWDALDRTDDETDETS